jgi:hypothetical protein
MGTHFSRHHGGEQEVGRGFEKSDTQQIGSKEVRIEARRSTALNATEAMLLARVGKAAGCHTICFCIL